MPRASSGSSVTRLRGKPPLALEPPRDGFFLSRIRAFVPPARLAFDQAYSPAHAWPAAMRSCCVRMPRSRPHPHRPAEPDEAVVGHPVGTSSSRDHRPPQWLAPPASRRCRSRCTTSSSRQSLGRMARAVMASLSVGCWTSTCFRPSVSHKPRLVAGDGLINGLIAATSGMRSRGHNRRRRARGTAAKTSDQSQLRNLSAECPPLGCPRVKRSAPKPPPSRRLRDICCLRKDP